MLQNTLSENTEISGEEKFIAGTIDIDNFKDYVNKELTKLVCSINMTKTEKNI